jgi:hypothetical protein
VIFSLLAQHEARILSPADKKALLDVLAPVAETFLCVKSFDRALLYHAMLHRLAPDKEESLGAFKEVSDKYILNLCCSDGEEFRVDMLNRFAVCMEDLEPKKHHLDWLFEHEVCISPDRLLARLNANIQNVTAQIAEEPDDSCLSLHLSSLEKLYATCCVRFPEISDMKSLLGIAKNGFSLWALNEIVGAPDFVEGAAAATVGCAA